MQIEYSYMRVLSLISLKKKGHSSDKLQKVFQDEEIDRGRIKGGNKVLHWLHEH